MLQKTSVSPINSLEEFCFQLTQKLSSVGFDIDIQPGVHLIDDAGADSLLVLYYVLQLQEMGLNIDLTQFDTDLLNIDLAYQKWACTTEERIVSRMVERATGV